MSRILAGPFCTMILGDLGAEVIKIESPYGGDETRRWGPPFINGESIYFICVNRNKKSIAIDIKKPQGKELLMKLATESDVLVENFVPGKLNSLGLGYESFKSVAPHLIYCSITGFGQTGPYATRPGLDVIVASVGGLFHITGPEGGQPCKAGVAVTDLATGLYAQGAIMAALIHRMKTGNGQKIDCDLFSTQVSSLVNIGSNYLNSGVEAKRWGTAHESIVPYQAFETRDSYITIGATSNDGFKKMCKLLTIPEFCADPRFSSNEERVKNRKTLISKLSEIFLKHPTEYWLRVFDGSGLPYGPVNNMEQVFNDPQVIHKKLVVDLEHSTAGPIKVIGPAVTFSESINKVRSPPPILGEHTDAVLSEVLSCSTQEIRHLRETKTVC
ncbi:succinate--hydroxymethylglutarate CoA-transferase isoform X2 [Parasteatoda tepidariorum]